MATKKTTAKATNTKVEETIELAPEIETETAAQPEPAKEEVKKEPNVKSAKPKSSKRKVLSRFCVSTPELGSLLLEAGDTLDITGMDADLVKLFEKDGYISKN